MLLESKKHFNEILIIMDTQNVIIPFCYSFSLTLIDTLDTLVVLGDVNEFEKGVKLVIDNVSFDQDFAVSVFETNIRVVG